ncbi:unnamed protein product [Zymoseptoria tritici ST99CH_3D7]|uniref:Uncharacterized protein n=1 Tax=Zymoseptoria tritici (strain ST99CH_3D7) TaxID=1276538 RepID=A0A1X7RM81_ZYMT9|nr:unnamed protein product [Zymoseptoria tritici ST99CH_3D7]
MHPFTFNLTSSVVTSEVLEEHALHNATIYRFLRTKTVPRSTHRPPIPQSGEAAVLKNPRPTLHTAEACDNGLPAPIGRPLADELRFYDHETIHQHTRRPLWVASYTSKCETGLELHRPQSNDRFQDAERGHGRTSRGVRRACARKPCIGFFATHLAPR